MYDGNILSCYVGMLLGLTFRLKLSTIVLGLTLGPKLGIVLGSGLDCTLGIKLGSELGNTEGNDEGTVVGIDVVGTGVGGTEAILLGLSVRFLVGVSVGILVGAFVGSLEGSTVGLLERLTVGLFVGLSVGFALGISVGDSVVAFAAAAMDGLTDASALFEGSSRSYAVKYHASHYCALATTTTSMCNIVAFSGNIMDALTCILLPGCV